MRFFFLVVSLSFTNISFAQKSPELSPDTPACDLDTSVAIYQKDAGGVEIVDIKQESKALKIRSENGGTVLGAGSEGYTAHCPKVLWLRERWADIRGPAEYFYTAFNLQEASTITGQCKYIKDDGLVASKGHEGLFSHSNSVLKCGERTVRAMAK